MSPLPVVDFFIEVFLRDLDELLELVGLRVAGCHFSFALLFEVVLSYRS